MSRSRGRGKVIRGHRRTFTKKRVLFAAAIIALVFIVSEFALTYHYEPTTTLSPTPTKPRAAIIDSLYVMDHNSDFYKRANDTLSNMGYKVDVILGGNVTVESFKNITGYKIIILRVHTAKEGSLIVFFTGTRSKDPNQDTGYMLERTVGWVRIGEVEGQYFYAVTPTMIVEGNGQAKFENTTIIVDSCYGLSTNSMAQAFTGKGASTYIAWDKGVYPQYADNATLKLLELISKQVPVTQAISQVPKEPDFGSILSSYP
jgi:hypothetical protein